MSDIIGANNKTYGMPNRWTADMCMTADGYTEWTLFKDGKMIDLRSDWEGTEVEARELATWMVRALNLSQAIEDAPNDGVGY